jgi:threonine dehydrogenase-like Zn-dependent dehydrogenase
MKAVSVFPGTRDLRITDEPEPHIDSPTSVKLRVLQVGICGTDKEIASFDYGEPPEGSDHLVIGHESLCEVVEAGPEVQTLRPGDLAVVMVRRPCGRPDCLACRAGRQDFCYTGEFRERGIKQINGFMTEIVEDEERYIVPVPRELRDIGVLTEPLTIAEKAFIQVLEIQQRLPWLSPATGSEPPLTGRQGVVLGAGPVGLLGAMKLVLSGCETAVYSREAPGSDKARLVESLGARYVSAEQCKVSDLPRQLGAIDFVYEATGASALAFEVLGVLGANAIFVFTGVPGRKHPVELDTSHLMRNMVLQNQLVLGTVNAGRDAFEAAVRDLTLFRKRFGEDVARLITGHVRMEDFPKMDLPHLGGIKNVLDVA